MNFQALPFSTQRTLILAPHPDDDVIAAGGLIQRVRESGGEVTVLFITDGENNPWPQRLLDRKIFLSREDRARWGAMRRREGLGSLGRLGVGEHSAVFLAFPDQGIAALARSGDTSLRDALRKTIDAVAPTAIVSPSSFDQHSDHRAIAYFAHRAAPEATFATYVVHGSGPADREVARLELSPLELKKKFDAIECHESQLALSRERFLAIGRRSEIFYRPEFDVVRVDSAMRERILGFRHAMQVCFGAYPEPPASGVQPAADVEDRAGDVAGLL